MKQIKLILNQNDLNMTKKKHDFEVHVVDTGVSNIDLHNEGLNNKHI